MARSVAPGSTARWSCSVVMQPKRSSHLATMRCSYLVLLSGRLCAGTFGLPSELIWS